MKQNKRKKSSDTSVCTRKQTRELYLFFVSEINWMFLFSELSARCAARALVFGASRMWKEWLAEDDRMTSEAFPALWTSIWKMNFIENKAQVSRGTLQAKKFPNAKKTHICKGRCRKWYKIGLLYMINFLHHFWFFYSISNDSFLRIP